MQTWNIGDTIAAKNSKAQVIAADGKGWVKVRHDGQEYEGYQVDFEAKGWRKRPKGSALGGCLTLFAILFGFGGCTAMLISNVPDAQTQPAAQSPKKPGLTLTAYNRVKAGMSYEEVVNILGQGTEISRVEVPGTPTTVMYQWQDGLKSANATFQNNKLMSKAQFGLN